MHSFIQNISMWDLNNLMEIEDNNITQLIQPAQYSSIIFKLISNPEIKKSSGERIDRPTQIHNLEVDKKLLTRTVTEIGICYTSYNQIISEVSSE